MDVSFRGNSPSLLLDNWPKLACLISVTELSQRQRKQAGLVGAKPNSMPFWKWDFGTRVEAA